MATAKFMPSRRLLSAALITLLSANAAIAAEPTVNTGGLHAKGSYDRFIVKYRDGSTEHRSLAAAQRALSGVSRRSACWLKWKVGSNGLICFISRSVSSWPVQCGSAGMS